MKDQTQAAERDFSNVEATRILRGLIEANDLAAAMRINRDTLSRMTRSGQDGFPQPFRLGLNTYYSESAVRRWLATRPGLNLDE